MALNRIWVLAEAAEGKVVPITLEMLTKARELGGTVEAVYGGGDEDAIAETLGAYGATKVDATGDLGGSLPGVPVASAIAKAVADGDEPDLMMIGTTYDGRDIAGRLSVALDKPVITNNVDVAVEGDAVVVTEPVFGGTKLVRTKFTAGGPHIALFRPKSFAAESSGSGAAAVASLDVTDAGVAKVQNRHVEESTGPKLYEAEVVVSGGRGLAEAEK
jgi:electron transfer flavoprotein alpha subunit